MIIHYLAFSFFILLHFPDQRGSVKSFSSFTLISLLYIWNDEIIQCHFRKKKVVTVSFHNWWWFVLSKYTILPDHSSDYYVDPFTLIQYQQITKKIKQKRQAIFTACRFMSEWGDSNARPLRPERSALPTALHSECNFSYLRLQRYVYFRNQPNK